jgi:ubiquinone/menaquinone biosynthesis C-methylase UbiE
MVRRLRSHPLRRRQAARLTARAFEFPGVERQYRWGAMSIFRELTEGLPRQAPGSAAATLRALGLVRGLPDQPRILDVGCGPGAQTIELARATCGWIVAVDIRQRFLDELTERAAAAGVLPQVTTVNTSMFDMDFADASFDLIWSEGAIYIEGFATGLTAWRRFLKPGGWLVVSELTWLMPDRPAEAAEYWARSYPAMGSIERNCQIVAEAGYVSMDGFVLPVQDWWNNYYGPSERRVEELREKYAGDSEILATLDETSREHDLFRAYHDAYGYVFYIMRKPI